MFTLCIVIRFALRQRETATEEGGGDEGKRANGNPVSTGGAHSERLFFRYDTLNRDYLLTVESRTRCSRQSNYFRRPPCSRDLQFNLQHATFRLPF